MKINAILLILLVTASCVDKAVPELKSTNDKLLGYWINLEYSDTLLTAQKSTALDSTQYCFGFESNHSFIENKNVGWCGTPPIAYGQYEGNWNLQDSTLFIETPYWGGTAKYTWKLLELTETTLRIGIIEQEYLMEE